MQVYDETLELIVDGETASWRDLRVFVEIWADRWLRRPVFKVCARGKTSRPAWPARLPACSATQPSTPALHLLSTCRQGRVSLPLGQVMERRRLRDTWPLQGAGGKGTLTMELSWMGALAM